MLSCFGTEEEVLSEFEAIERKNVKVYGYGVKSHTLSMIETALKISNNAIRSEIISRLLSVGKGIFNKPLDIFNGVEEVLETLSKVYKLVIITKGDLLDQNKKIEESGLNKYFYKSFVVTEKREDDYSKIISSLGCSPEEFLMVGNSLPSDIIPVLNIGGYGVHIPHNYICHHERVDEEVAHFNLFSFNNITELLNLDLIKIPVR